MGKLAKFVNIELSPFTHSREDSINVKSSNLHVLNVSLAPKRPRLIQDAGSGYEIKFVSTIRKRSSDSCSRTICLRLQMLTYKRAEHSLGQITVAI